MHVAKRASPPHRAGAQSGAASLATFFATPSARRRGLSVVILSQFLRGSRYLGVGQLWEADSAQISGDDPAGLGADFQGPLLGRPQLRWLPQGFGAALLSFATWGPLCVEGRTGRCRARRRRLGAACGAPRPYCSTRSPSATGASGSSPPSSARRRRAATSPVAALSKSAPRCSHSASDRGAAPGL